MSLSDSFTPISPFLLSHILLDMATDHKQTCEKTDGIWSGHWLQIPVPRPWRLFSFDKTTSTLVGKQMKRKRHQDLRLRTNQSINLVRCDERSWRNCYFIWDMWLRWLVISFFLITVGERNSLHTFFPFRKWSIFLPSISLSLDLFVDLVMLPSMSHGDRQSISMHVGNSDNLLDFVCLFNSCLCFLAACHSSQQTQLLWHVCCLYCHSFRLSSFLISLREEGQEVS